MGLRTRFRQRKKSSLLQSVDPHTAPKPSSPLDSPQFHIPDPSIPHPPVNNVQERNVEPLANYEPIDASMGRRMTVHSAEPIAPSITSSGSSLFGSGAGIKRFLREKLTKLNPSSRGSEHSEKDVPDSLSEEDVRIVKSEDGSERVVKMERGRTQVLKKIDDRNSAGSQIEIGVDVESGVRVNDGYVSFVVPEGWLACRKHDCFYLFHGLSVGYVRSVVASSAAKALLETGRLQVVTHVSAVSSPVFRNKGIGAETEEDVERLPFMQVEYSSQLGGGRGLAMFTHAFKSRACVFALCGSREDLEMIDRGIEELSRTAYLINAHPSKDLNMKCGGECAQNEEVVDGGETDTQPSPETQCIIQ